MAPKFNVSRAQLIVALPYDSSDSDYARNAKRWLWDLVDLVYTGRTKAGRRRPHTYFKSAAERFLSS